MKTKKSHIAFKFFMGLALALSSYLAVAETETPTKEAETIPKPEPLPLTPIILAGGTARVYFDLGNDDEDEIDIYDNGALTPTVQVVEIFWPRKFYSFLGDEGWRWGPSVGLGLGAPANNSEDGTKKASGSVVLLNGGLILAFPSSVKDSLFYAVEAGYVFGVTADESFGDTTDKAAYIGLGIKLAL